MSCFSKWRLPLSPTATPWWWAGYCHVRRLCYAHPFTPLVNNLPSFLSVSFPPISWTFYHVVWTDCSRAAEPEGTLVKTLARWDDLHSLCSSGTRLQTEAVATLNASYFVHWCSLVMMEGLVLSGIPQSDCHQQQPPQQQRIWSWDRNVSHHFSPFGAFSLSLLSTHLPRRWMQMEEAQASETRWLCTSALTPLRHRCQQRAGFTAAYERVRSVCMNIMGWPAVVLSGRQAGWGGGVAEWV